MHIFVEFQCVTEFIIGHVTVSTRVQFLLRKIEQHLKKYKTDHFCFFVSNAAECFNFLTILLADLVFETRVNILIV